MWPKRAMLVGAKSFLKSVIYVFSVCNLCFQITVFKKNKKKETRNKKPCSQFFPEMLKFIAVITAYIFQFISGTQHPCILSEG